MNKISVIICTYDKSRLLEAALQSLADQNIDKSSFEVIVVDNNSKDKTKEVVLSSQNKLDVKYVFEKNQGLSYARNRGILESKTDFVAFLDDDAKADEDWVEEANKIIEEENPSIFGGPIYPFYDSTKPVWFKNGYGSFFICDKKRYLSDKEFLCGSNIFFRKEIFDKIGYFDVALGMKGDQILLGEEVKIQNQAKRKNVKIYHDNDLIVYHLIPNYKMSLKYIIKRHYLSAIYSGRIFCDRAIGGLIYNFFYYIIASLGWIFLFPFKRKSYPQFINLLIEKIFPKLELASINFLAIYFKFLNKKSHENSD